MKYIIRPLQSFEEYLHYFEKRCEYDKKFHPERTDYFQSRYEVDYYDLFSRHYGLFLRNTQADTAIGYVRITRNIELRNSWYYELSEEVKAFILDSLRQSKIKAHLPALPFLEQFDRRFNSLYQYLKHKDFTAELGRLIVFDPKTNFKILSNFISYTLAMGQYSDLDYYLFKAKCRHAKIYHRYYGADYLSVKEHANGLTPCAYDLRNLSAKSQAIVQRIHQQFVEADEIIPVEFIDHRIISTNQPILDYDIN